MTEHPRQAGSTRREPLWLTEHDVERLLTLPDAVDAVRVALRREAVGQAQSANKSFLHGHDGSTLHALGAIDSAAALGATKTWLHTPSGASPVAVLWSCRSGRLLAVVEAFALGQLRTAAVSAVATERLSSPDAEVLAIIGSGKQAMTQVDAVRAVRPVAEVRVYSPTQRHRHEFVERLRSRHAGIDVVAASSVHLAVAGADIVTTVTRATEPFLDSGSLRPGTHINAVGAIAPDRRELRANVLDRCPFVVADGVESARRLAAEIADTKVVRSLADLVADTRVERGDDLSVFKSMGIGLADLAVTAALFARAEELDQGARLPVQSQPAARAVEAE